MLEWENHRITNEDFNYMMTPPVSMTLMSRIVKQVKMIVGDGVSEEEKLYVRNLQTWSLNFPSEWRNFNLDTTVMSNLIYSDVVRYTNDENMTNIGWTLFENGSILSKTKYV
jgi:hypothetical protein